VAELPAGFEDPFTISVGGNILGQFAAGQGVNFQSFPGGGVSQFEISGVNPITGPAGPFNFPLKLAFTTPTGNFAASAVPEPATPLTLGFAILALNTARRRSR
jgi:hypothetical protein